jgi:magnesium-transporting ATPase (P-type)
MAASETTSLVSASATSTAIGGGTFDQAYGLSSTKAAELLKQDGPNVLQGAATESFLQILITQMRNMIFLLTSCAAAASWAMGDEVKAVVLIAMVFVVCFINAVGEYSGQDPGAALRKEMEMEPVTTIRDGREVGVPTSELVVGDVVTVGMGNMVPADILVLESLDLQTNEAALTGEPNEQHKTSEPPKAQIVGLQPNMLYSGTSIVCGKGTGEVVATGMRTEIGLVAHLLEDGSKAAVNPLQESINFLGAVIAAICLVVIVIATLASYLTGYQNPITPCSDDDDLCLLLSSLNRGILMAVSLIPHGLPFVVMVMLRVGSKEMAARNAVVTRRTSVDYLGATSVICTDKTGTLTQGKMTAQLLTSLIRCSTDQSRTYPLPTTESHLEFYPLRGLTPNGGVFESGKLTPEAKSRMDEKKKDMRRASDAQMFSEPGLPDLRDPVAAQDRLEAKLLQAHLASGFLNCYATKLIEDNGIWSACGNMTEAAVKVAAAKGGFWDEGDGPGARLYATCARNPDLEVPFTSKRKMMATVHALPQDKQVASMTFQEGDTHFAIVKGAPDKLLPRLRSVMSEGLLKAEPAAISTGKNPNVKHVFFDFDLTISVIHVFKQVAGWEPGVQPPHASCERGQIHRIMELNAAGKWSYMTQTGTVTVVPLGTAGGCSWTAAALGGSNRVQSLRLFFSKLKDRGVKLTIITKGNVGAVRCLLAQENLLDMFEEVFGMIGESGYPMNDYDHDHQEVSEYEGTLNAQLKGRKADLIKTLMFSKGLSGDEALLVEDDPAEVKSVQGLCKGFFISARKGMTDSEMASILQMAPAAFAGEDRRSPSALDTIMLFVPGKNISDADRTKIEARNADLASKALRSLLVAICPLSAAEFVQLQQAPGADERLELLVSSRLCFISLWGIYDPPRPAVPGSVRECHGAGIRVVMVTGDQYPTAVAIGKQVNIIDDTMDPKESAALCSELHVSHKPVHVSQDLRKRLSQKTLERLDSFQTPDPAGSVREEDEKRQTSKQIHNTEYKSQDELARITSKVNVWARAQPMDKVELVRSLLLQRYITAMTGDGVNDAPALQLASAGVAMGISGTAVAKNASDLILMDDDFSTIVAAIREGRRIYSNTQKYVTFNLSVKAGECICLMSAIVTGLPMPIRGLQLLFNLIVTHILPPLSLAWEKPEAYLMQVPPRDVKADFLVSRVLWLFRWLPFILSMPFLVTCCVTLGVWSNTGFFTAYSLIGSSRTIALEQGQVACEIAGVLNSENRFIEDSMPFHCLCHSRPHGNPFSAPEVVEQWGRIIDPVQMSQAFDRWTGSTGDLFMQENTPWHDGREALLKRCEDRRGVERWCWRNELPEGRPWLPGSQHCAAYGAQLGQSMAYTTIHLGEILTLLTFRTDDSFILHTFTNVVYTSFFVFNISMLAAFLYVPAITALLQLAPLSLWRLVIAISFAICLAFVNELVKILYRVQLQAHNDRLREMSGIAKKKHSGTDFLHQVP